jgi:hypothetical protein
VPHRLALAAAAVTVILAAAIVAALASFSATVSTEAVRTSLASNPGTTISVTGSVSSTTQAAGAGRTITASLSRALPGVPLTVWSAVSSDYLNIPPGRGLAHGQTHVISLAELSRHATLLAGSWPGPGGPAGTVPAAVPAALASALHLAPGMLLRLHDSVTGSPVSVRITGIFRPLNPASPYWLLDSAATGVQLSGGFAVYSWLVTTPSVMAAGSIPITTAAWSVRPDVTGLGTGNLRELAARLQTALGSLAQLSQLQNVTAVTSLPGLLSGLSTALVVTRSQLAIGASILLVIAGATLALATVMLSGARQAEMALMRTRGASRRQLAGSGVAEAILLILPAVVAAPLLGGLLLPPLARYGPLARSGLRAIPGGCVAGRGQRSRGMRHRDHPSVAAPRALAGGRAGADRPPRRGLSGLARWSRPRPAGARCAGRMAARPLRRSGLGWPGRVDRHRSGPCQRPGAGTGRRGCAAAAAAAAAGQAR